MNIYKFTRNNSKLLVDGALGKLSRWLRIVGYDVAYDPDLVRMQIIERAVEEDRIIITGSKRTMDMSVKKKIQSVLIYGISVNIQIKQLIKNGFKIDELDISYSRCSLCNGNLIKTSDPDDLNQIPSGTKQYQFEFYKCTSCKHLYWEGSHWKRMRSMIKQSNIIDLI